MQSTKTIVGQIDQMSQCKKARNSFSHFSLESVSKLNKIMQRSNLLSRFRDANHQTNSLRTVPLDEILSSTKHRESEHKLPRLQASTNMKSHSPTKTFQPFIGSPEIKKRRGKKINSQFSEIIPVFPELKRGPALDQVSGNSHQNASQAAKPQTDKLLVQKSLKIRTIRQLDRIDEMQGIRANCSKVRISGFSSSQNPSLQPKTFSSFRMKPVIASSKRTRGIQEASHDCSDQNLSSLSEQAADELFFAPKKTGLEAASLSPMSLRNGDTAERFNLKDCSLLERCGSESGSSGQKPPRERHSSRGLIPLNSKSDRMQRKESSGCDKHAPQSTQAGLSSNQLNVPRPT
jgi:hypothetical protein